MNNDQDTERRSEGDAERSPFAGWTVVAEDASFQNAWAVLGPAALIVFPLSWAVVRIRRIVGSR